MAVLTQLLIHGVSLGVFPEVVYVFTTSLKWGKKIHFTGLGAD